MSAYVDKFAAVRQRVAAVLGCDPKLLVFKLGTGTERFLARQDVEEATREAISRAKPSIYVKAGDKKEQALLPLVKSGRPLGEWDISRWAAKVQKHYFSLSFSEFVALSDPKMYGKRPSYLADNGQYIPPAGLRDQVENLMALAMYGGALTKAIRTIGKQEAKDLPRPPSGATDDDWGDYRTRQRKLLKEHKSWTPELVIKHAARILDNGHLGDPDKEYPNGKPLAMRPGVREATIYLTKNNTLKPVDGHPWNMEFRLGDDWAIFDGRAAYRQAYRLFGDSKTWTNADAKVAGTKWTPAQLRALFGDGTIRFSRRENRFVAALMFRTKTVPVSTKKVGNYKKSSSLGLPVVGIDLGAAMPLAATLVATDQTVLGRWIAGRRLGSIEGATELVPWTVKNEFSPKNDNAVSVDGRSRPREAYFKANGKWPEESQAERVSKQVGVQCFAEIEERSNRLSADVRAAAMSQLTPDERRRLEAKEDPAVLIQAIGDILGPTWDRIRAQVVSQLNEMKSGARPSTIISELLFELDPSRGIEKNALVTESLPEKVIDGWLVSERGWAFTSDARWIKIARDRVSPRALEMKLQQLSWEIQRRNPEYRKLSLATEQLCQYVCNRLVEEVQAVVGEEFVIAIENDLVSFVGGGNRKGKSRERSGFSSMCKIAHKEARKWFMRPLWNALSKLATEKGLTVVDVPKERTSLRCPKLCGYIATKAEDVHCTTHKFQCLNPECGWEGDADLDVGSVNIALIALTGERIERTDVEKSPRKKTSAKAA